MDKSSKNQLAVSKWYSERCSTHKARMRPITSSQTNLCTRALMDRNNAHRKHSQTTHTSNTTPHTMQTAHTYTHTNNVPTYNVHTGMHTHAHTCTCTHHTHNRPHMHTHTHSNSHAYTHAHARKHTYRHGIRLHKHTRTQAHRLTSTEPGIRYYFIRLIISEIVMVIKLIYWRYLRRRMVNFMGNYCCKYWLLVLLSACNINNHGCLSL